MSVTAGLRDALKLSAAVAALTDDRVFRDERPEGTELPAVVLLLVSDPRPLTYSGPQSVRPARVQADCLGRNRGEADELGEAVIAAVEGRALAGLDQFDSVRIVNVRNDVSREPPTKIYRTAIDLMVWHHPTN